MRHLPGIDPLLAEYDAFLVDQYGTLHDGVALYPGAAAALRRMRAAGKRVALLSNSGKRSAANISRLTRLGIAPDAYDAFITSGEVAFQLLARDLIPAARGARRCLLLERDGDGAALDGLGLETASAEMADLLVIAGSEGDWRTLDSYAEQLGPLARRGIHALCLNPDRVMLTPSGPAFGAGRIGELYEQLGGEVTWIGKPHPAIYRAALRLLDDPAPSRVAGIGDSVEHDVAGARAAGVGAWLVHAGILADADDATIAAECHRHGVAPDGVLDGFA
jgi:HAD superfamily hydrolase (TIGR01459 family)